MKIIKSTPNLTKKELYQLTASMERLTLSESKDDLLITAYVEYVPTNSEKMNLAIKTPDGIYVTNSQAFIDSFDCCNEFKENEDESVHIRKIRKKAKSGGIYYVADLVL